jgi:biotin operon repressor
MPLSSASALIRHLNQLQQALLFGPKSGRELQAFLGVSQATLSRTIHQARSQGVPIQIFGSRKDARYALLRSIETLSEKNLPVLRIDEAGTAHSLGSLVPIHPRGYVFERSSNTASNASKTKPYEIFSDLPFFFEDLRPQGYLGRSFTHKHPDLNLPDRIADWSNDQIVRAVAKRSENTPGNLIIGSESFDRWTTSPKERTYREEEYEKALQDAESTENAGSSAGGEQPKFTHSNRFIVKYSPSLTSPEGKRWADLLAAEAIALRLLGTKTRLIHGKGRVFLETERFDRNGAKGRIGIISLHAYALENLRSPKNWTHAGIQLHDSGKISRETLHSILKLEAFGSMIANTDRHFGNLSFFWDLSTPRKKLTLTPAYDMLPMAFAPRGSGTLPAYEEWTPPQPTTDTLSAWPEARSLAIQFWETASTNSSCSSAFRKAAEKFSRKLAQ